jgi:putative component of membrane protein insertase Oxa1/YidC/SpoIIIJ protein YidD
MQKRIPIKLPIPSLLNSATRSLAVTAITGYQRFISPYKGFSCAHRVLYGCESCSQYFKRVISEEGIFTAITNAKGRFQECREANEILKVRKAKCRASRKYYASRLTSNSVAIESGESDDSEQEPENADATQDRQNPENTDTKKLGGSRWARKERSQVNSNGNNNNCDYGIDDCSDCANCTDVITDIPSDCINNFNCDNANCLSGMDCSGLDCGALDCSGLDCGALDCGSCS